MKATDLMIGDWVLYNGLPKVVQMIDGYGDTELEDVIICDGMFHTPIEVSPMPLTAEILEKNSIQKVDYHTYVIGHNDERQDLYFSFSHDYNEIIVITYYDDEYGYHEISFGKICYVHEFQHLLHLYGIEKEVVI